MGPGSGTACQVKCEKQLTMASFADWSGTGMTHHAIALYVGKQLTANMFFTMPILCANIMNIAFIVYMQYGYV